MSKETKEKLISEYLKAIESLNKKLTSMNFSYVKFKEEQKEIKEAIQYYENKITVLDKG